MLKALLSILLVSSIFSLFDKNSKVVQLTKNNFDKLVIQSDQLWLVEFYAPWCGHCKSLAPEWSKAALALKGIVNIGAVDMTTDEEAGSRYGIKGFPTLKFFGENKNSPKDYSGQRQAKAIVDFALKEAQTLATKRLTPSSSSSSSSSQTGLIELDDSNFEANFMQSNEAFFIKVYAPWCGHCKTLAPVWEQLSQQVKGVKIAKYDADSNKQYGSAMGVSGFPTLIFFPAGKKSLSSGIKYEGGRDLDSLLNYVQTEAKKNMDAKFEQLVSQEQFQKTCEETAACFIAFIPHILDVTLEERDANLKNLKAVAEKNKESNVAFFWSQGGDQFDFEDALEMGSGYPAFVAISLRKKAFVPMRQSYTQQNLESFVRNLLSGMEKLRLLKKTLPDLKKSKKWDGSKPVPQEDL